METFIEVMPGKQIPEIPPEQATTKDVSDSEEDKAALANWRERTGQKEAEAITCLLYTSPSPRDKRQSRMPSSA